MIRRISPILFISLLFIFTSINIYASSDFETNVNIEYKFHGDGRATVTNTITLKNKKSDKYSKSYILNIYNLDPKNVKAFESGSELHVERLKQNEKTEVEIIFENPVYGQGKERTFVITYETDKLSEKSGNVWEILIPRISDSNLFDSYNITLSVDNSFGKLAYISPDPDSEKQLEGRKQYFFSKEKLQTSNILAGFGHFQSYSFKLKYHLENEKTKNSIYEIAIPPDTSTQRVFYKNIKPDPKNVYVDSDGNWISVFYLKPKQKIDVEVKGLVQIYPVPRSLVSPEPSYLLETTKEKDFWPVYDNDIKKLSRELQTPENIYNFVVNKLSYDLNRVKPDTKRLGAKEALKNPSSATCMEFTDLFIAICRAAGIPAREINGYAHTENPEAEPLSLISDVLHAWPQYWDSEEKVWIPVDPTWESTSKGADYFNKLDLRHFAFVIHGKDPNKPYPAGSYKHSVDPKKDVFIEYGDNHEGILESINIEFSTKPTLNLLKKKLNINVLNEGVTAKYNFETKIYFDNKLESIEYIKSLPPMGKHSIKVEVAYGIFGNSAPSKINILVDQKQFDIDSKKNQAIIYQLLAVSMLLLVISLAVIIKIKNVSLTKSILKIFKYATKKANSIKRKFKKGSKN